MFTLVFFILNSSQNVDLNKLRKAQTNSRQLYTLNGECVYSGESHQKKTLKSTKEDSFMYLIFNSCDYILSQNTIGTAYIKNARGIKDTSCAEKLIRSFEPVLNSNVSLILS